MLQRDAARASQCRPQVEFTLNPGYYRFAINPKKTPLQIYVPPGTDTELITTYDEDCRDAGTGQELNSGGVHKSSGQSEV
jgi:hypothetical protein